MFDDVKIKNWLKKRLKGEKYSHSIGAEETARELASKFNIDADKAAFAALLHDNAKYISADKMLEIVNENNLPVFDMEKETPKTLHSPVGAYIAQTELGIEDSEILNAIRYHTIGKVNMTDLEKIVFLADKIEPYTRDSKFREKVLTVLDQTNNLDEAVLLCYEATIKNLVNKRLLINIQTIEVWNSLVANLKNTF